jgi:hypothetical protein
MQSQLVTARKSFIEPSGRRTDILTDAIRDNLPNMGFTYSPYDIWQEDDSIVLSHHPLDFVPDEHMWDADHRPDAHEEEVALTNDDNVNFDASPPPDWCGELIPVYNAYRINVRTGHLVTDEQGYPCPDNADPSLIVGYAWFRKSTLEHFNHESIRAKPVDPWRDNLGMDNDDLYSIAPSVRMAMASTRDRD